jgi:hypothetical protein
MGRRPRDAPGAGDLAPPRASLSPHRRSIAQARVDPHQRGVGADVVPDDDQCAEPYGPTDVPSHHGVPPTSDAAHGMSRQQVRGIDGEMLMRGRVKGTKAAQVQTADNVLSIRDPAPWRHKVRSTGTPTGGIVSRPWAEACASHGGVRGESAGAGSHPESIP